MKSELECVFCKEDATHWDLYYNLNSGGVYLCEKHWNELRSNISELRREIEKFKNEK